MTPVRLRVAELREAKGWSQAELGRQAGVRRATIHALEQTPAFISFAMLEKVAAALGVDPSALLVNDPSPRARKPRGR